MDISTKAITLTANDYRENDKILTLYSLELGKIGVTARGIKKPTAKLRFAQEPFCLGSYELAERGGNYTLKTCVQDNSFFALREDIQRFVAGCVITESIAKLEPYEQPDQQLFVCILKHLVALQLEDVNPLLVAVHYLLDFLSRSGYSLDFSHCSVCGTSAKHMYIDVQNGGVKCDKCISGDSIQLSQQVVAVLNIVNGLNIDKLPNINATDSQIKDCLRVLDSYVVATLGKLNSITQLIKL